MRRLRYIIPWLLAMLLIFPALSEPALPAIETGIARIQKYGNIVLQLSGSALMDQGYEYGDLIAVELGGATLEMPICADYAQVDSGAAVCRIKVDEASGESAVILALRDDSLAIQLNLAQRVDIQEDPGYRWDYDPDMPITLSLVEKGGYRNKSRHRLNLSIRREDYPELTDAQYANFRPVTTTGMGKNALFRSTSPINPAYNRNREADEAVNLNGIHTCINLADSQGEMEGYPDFRSSYYSQLDIVPLNLMVRFRSDDFRQGVVRGLRYMLDHEGPWLVHCTLGKDRTGFVCALLEALMGADEAEILADYMTTYENFYHLKPEDAAYRSLAESARRESLSEARAMDLRENPDLARCARKWLVDAGMTEAEIQALKMRLREDVG